jgi:acetyl esterase/lipase
MEFRKNILCLLCVSLLIQVTPILAATKKRKPAATLPAGVQVSRDLEYKQPFRRPLALDLYRPQTIKKKLPVVIWIHGGGWKNGSKNRCPATWLATQGFAVASISYRLTHEARWPAQIDDCREAVRWLRKNARRYRLDSENIGIWGSSAGGHLVAILGTIDPPAGEKISSRVQAACDWFGPTDLLTMPPNNVSKERSLEMVANSNGAKLLGATVRDVPGKAKHASGLYHVSSDDPPFLVMHGDKDPGVPISQSERFVKALRAAKVDVTWQVVKGAGHGGKQFKTPEMSSVVQRFFERTLKN